MGFGEAEGSEPLFKFNNGHDGDCKDVLFNRGYDQHPKGLLAGMFEDVLKSPLAELLSEQG